MNKNLTLIFFLLASIIYQNTAKAKSFASAKIKSITYELTDLNPNDNIVPKLYWADTMGLSFANANNNVQIDKKTGYFANSDNFRLTADSYPAYAFVSHEDNNLLMSPTLGTITAEGYATGFGSYSARNESIDRTAVSDVSIYYFAITNYTKVTFHMNAEAKAQITSTTLNNSENAFAQVGVKLIDQNGFTSYSKSLSSEVSTAQSSSLIDSKFEEFNMQWEYADNGSKYDNKFGRASIYFDVAVNGFTSPAPEPATYALILVGLTGINIRRSKSKKSVTQTSLID